MALSVGASYGHVLEVSNPLEESGALVVDDEALAQALVREGFLRADVERAGFDRFVSYAVDQGIKGAARAHNPLPHLIVALCLVLLAITPSGLLCVRRHENT